MKIVYFGSGQFGIDCLDALADSGNSPEFIVTQPPQPAGRGQKPTLTAVARWAESHSVGFIETDNVNAPEVYEKLAVLQPDLIVVIAFGQKISNKIISLPKNGTINVHSSLLPKYRGAAPINRAIINGESRTGISIITVSERMDAGDILAQTEAEILADETAGQLHARLAKIAAPLLLETLGKITDGTVRYTEQDDSKATAAPKLKKSDGFIDFAEPAEILARKIRGLWPWPTASSIYSSAKTDKRLRTAIAAANPIDSSNPDCLPVGTLDKNLNVICGRGALKITKIKPAGKKMMTFEDFVNGRHTQPGDRFVKINNPCRKQQG